MRDGPLDGIRVVDLTHMYAGPYCAQWLGDLGAEVIKVESTGRGDRVRYGPPPIMKDDTVAYPFLALNRNKRGIALDLATAEGRRILARLVERADVFLHNLRQSTIKRLGLAYDDLRPLNPRLVYASISGFGDHGPHRDLPGQDLQIQAMAGLMSITGYPDRVSVPAGEPIADAVTGILTAFGILAALYTRQATGVGQEVQASLFASLISLFPQEIATYMGTRTNPPRAETGSTQTVAPFGAWQTRDGKEIAISTWRDEPWGQFCEAIGRPELVTDPRFDTVAHRWQHQKELKTIVQEALRHKTSDEWIPLLRQYGQWVVPVRNFAEVCTGDSHLRDNELLLDLEHPVLGTTTLYGLPLKLSRTPLTVRRPAPLQGEHTREILGELGYTAAQIDALYTAGVVK